MGLMDNMKAKLGPARDKVSDLARQHGDKVQHGIDKAAKAVDERTKGKYSDKIQAGTGKAKGAMDRLAHKGGPEAPAGDPMPPTRPEGPPPAS
ncbi:antitoxin [Streptomyces actinomycinicus]|uniref:Antitoxin n=1 Tax=Streptomyces actinomycinicus TaxID=1695166 RepID=A0A937JQZ9_9ACTN|nr:antitoxin [Streptomyces actinomycinicus]MBL1085122.1 antitoxin [Streptomyces actinomycinicus]